MNREDGKGRCDSCGAEFGYYLVHNGFNDSLHVYCDSCGSTAIADLAGVEARLPSLPGRVTPITPDMEGLLQTCSCGGRFRRGAAPRCPSCREPLSAEGATTWIEANAPGAKQGWRWQRSWVGLYAIVVAGRVQFNPWKPGHAG